MMRLRLRLAGLCLVCLIREQEASRRNSASASVAEAASRVAWPHDFGRGVTHLRARHRASLNLSSASVDDVEREPSSFCGEVEKVTAQSDINRLCPESCPLWTKPLEGNFSFVCVDHSTSACEAVNPQKPVPDMSRGICRSCSIVGCQVCSIDQKERCTKCRFGFELADGDCTDIMWKVSKCVIGVVLFIVVVVGVWLLDLYCRPVTNRHGLRRALKLRSRAFLRSRRRASAHYGDAEERPSSRKRFSIWTNLTDTDVAGKGVMLLFNFQFAVILWAFAVTIAWTVFVHCVDQDFFRLGTRVATTPRQLSILILWGHETQTRLMGAKVKFVFCVYVASFIGALIFGVVQLRKFQRDDGDGNVSHKSFCARLTGLPEMNGSEYVEDEIKNALVAFTGELVVGVSVCWETGQDWEIAVQRSIDDLVSMEEHLRSSLWARSPPSARAAFCGQDMIKAEQESSNKWWRRGLYRLELMFVSPDVQRLMKKGNMGQRDSMCAIASDHRKSVSAMNFFREDSTATDASEEEPDMQEKISGFKTRSLAFVIFHTQAGRYNAIERVRAAGGMPFRDRTLRLEEATMEPQSVLWRDVNDRVGAWDWFRRIRSVVVGFVLILVASIVWIVVFYLPWAAFVMTRNTYAHKDTSFLGSNFLNETILSLTIVLGNVILYGICASVAGKIGFSSVDSRSVFYVIVYNFACLCQIVLDIHCMFVVAYKVMGALGLTGADGESIEAMTSDADRFDTYAVQKELGNALWSYAFPSTFLLSFLLEPIFVAFFPKMLMTLIVRTHREMKPIHAETFLAAPEMDLGRYGDLLLNVTLAVLMFYFPGGYMLKTFLSLACSHVIIYAIDHWRVIKICPSCEFSSMLTDWYAQLMLSVPCGLMLGSVVWTLTKSRDGPQRLSLVVLFILLHILVHSLLLIFVVPLFGRRAKPAASDMSYKECARMLPYSFFSTNPVHCLRSKHLYDHTPPMAFCLQGREHLQRVNTGIGAYFSDRAVQPKSLGFKLGEDETPNATPECSESSSFEPSSDEEHEQPKLHFRPSGSWRTQRPSPTSPPLRESVQSAA